MEVKKQEETKPKVIIPNIIGMTVKEAKALLQEKGLELKLNTNVENSIDNSKTTIVNQTPKQGIKAEDGGYVMVDI